MQHSAQDPSPDPSQDPPQDLSQQPSPDQSRDDAPQNPSPDPSREPTGAGDANISPTHESEAASASPTGDLDIGSIRDSAYYIEQLDSSNPLGPRAGAPDYRFVTVSTPPRPGTPPTGSAPSLATVIQPGTTSVAPPENVKQRIKESYDAIAPVYNQWTTGHHAHRMNYTSRLIELLRADRTHKNGGEHAHEEGEVELPLSAQEGINLVHLQGLQALEVGCGSGVPVLEILLSKNIDTVGVDISAAQIELARANFPTETATLRAVWAQKDIMDLRYPPSEFDVIVGLYSLVHLPREEQTVFLHRAQVWLKAGGMLMINFPLAELESDAMEHWLGQEKGWMYWSSWGEQKMMQIIEGLEGMEVLVKEVTEPDAGDPAFVWVIARKNRVDKPEFVA